MPLKKISFPLKKPPESPGYTLRSLADKNILRFYLTPSKQRRFDKECLQKYVNNTTDFIQEKPKKNFLYARVSSKKQSDDLSRQIEFLKLSDPKYASYTVVSDIASGLNFKRKGLSTLLDACVQGTINELVVAHRDRLSRFRFDLIQRFVEKAGGKIIIIDNPRNISEEKELTEDILSILHVYSCRQMGKRKYTRKNNEMHSNPCQDDHKTETDNKQLVSHI